MTLHDLGGNDWSSIVYPAASDCPFPQGTLEIEECVVIRGKQSIAALNVKNSVWLGSVLKVNFRSSPVKLDNVLVTGRCDRQSKKRFRSRVSPRQTARLRQTTIHGIAVLPPFPENSNARPAKIQFLTNISLWSRTFEDRPKLQVLDDTRLLR